jgi:hypothetical protein
MSTTAGTRVSGLSRLAGTTTSTTTGARTSCERRGLIRAEAAPRSTSYRPRRQRSVKNNNKPPTKRVGTPVNMLLSIAMTRRPSAWWVNNCSVCGCACKVPSPLAYLHSQRLPVVFRLCNSALISTPSGNTPLSWWFPSGYCYEQHHQAG